MRTDLHIHTTASDGCWSPERLAREIKKEGIKLFSVTDHDTIASIGRVQELVEREDLFFIPGVEISTTLEGHPFHILGYGIDPLNRNLRQLLDHNTYLMKKKDDDSIKALLELGYEIDYREYEEYENDPTRGGWKALNFLIDQGLCADVEEFFSHLFKVPFPVFPAPEEVIEVVVQAGGIPVLAHPGGNFNKALLLTETLEKFTQRGIQGVECFHPEHDVQTTLFCQKWCREKGLLLTGGSDCHGMMLGNRKLGYPRIFLSQLKLDVLEDRYLPREYRQVVE